jgi:hypothetical protein
LVERTLGMDRWPLPLMKNVPRHQEREGVGGAIKEGVVDDTTERQGEVAHANVVEAGV